MKLKYKLLIPVLAVLSLAIFAQGYIIVNQIQEKLVHDLIHGQMESQLDNLSESITTRRQVEETFFNTLNEKNLDLTKAVAEVIKFSPDALELANMTELAKSIGVDEIHVMDGDGVLRYGNIEGFFGFDFHTADQTLPFIDLIGKKDGRLAQDPSPRGTDNVLFQYIGVSRLDQDGIVQIGLEPQYIDELKKVIGIQTMIEGFKVGKSGYAYIIGSDGVTLYHHNPDNVGMDIHDIPVLEPLLSGGTGFFDYVYEGKKVYASYTQLDDWILVATVPEDDFSDSVKGIINNITIILIVILALVGILITLIATKLFNSIGTLVHNMELVGDGDLNVKVVSNSNDEMGALAKSFNKMIGDIKKLITNTYAIADGVTTSTNEIHSIIDNVTRNNAEISRAIDDIAVGATQQAQSSSDSVRAMNNLSSHIDSASEGLQETIKITDEVLKSSHKSEDSLKSLVESFDQSVSATRIVNKSIDELATKSSSINEIIVTIRSISDQTNLLALNAAIEAARAGEQGRGFAVVADEIRKLAEQSSRSAEEIGSIISEIVALVESTNSTILGTNTAIDKVNDSVNDTKGIFNEINTSIEEVSDYVARLGKQFSDINNIKNSVLSEIQKISDVSEHTAAGSEQISASTVQLTDDLRLIGAKIGDNIGKIDELNESLKVFKV